MQLMRWCSRGARAALLASACAVAPAAGWAQAPADRIGELERKLAQSLEMIEKLSQRVRDLERAAPPTAAASAPTAPAATATVENQGKAIAALQDSVSQIAEGLSRNGGDTGIPVHGFIDVGAGWSSRRDPARLQGFNAGSLDLYLTPQISNRVSALLELVFEFTEDGAEVDMERVQIGYSFNDQLTLWAGRFHTPFGYWNTAFHHGSNLQTSITRPQFLEFEDRGGLLPVHSVGLWAHGKTRVGGAGLTYDAYLANGPSIRSGRLNPNAFNDDNRGKLWGLNLGYQPGGTFGDLTAGLHAFGSRVNAYGSAAAPRSSTGLRAVGGYLGWDTDAWDVLAEYYRLRNEDGGTSRHSTAGYMQVGRSFGAFTPFVRYERAGLDAADPYFQSLRSGRSYATAAAGVSYSLGANASLKFELQRKRVAAATLFDDAGTLVRLDPAAFHRALMQLSIAF